MDNKNLWENKQWLKNILAKSGTEMKIENNEKEKRKMVYYTQLPLITHNAVLHGGSPNSRCGPSSSPPSNSSSPRLELSSIMNLSNNQITLQTLDSPSAAMQLHAQNYSNDQMNHKLVDLTYANLHQQQQQQQSQQQQQPPMMAMKNAAKFKCDQCNMSFGSKSAHTSHMKSHAKASMNGGGIDMTKTVNPANGADQYQCDQCQKTFAVPARLIRHYRTHTGERPFECEFCHKMFSVKENLQVHRRIHTKERPYKCSVESCGRAFEHSGKLHRHMRIHTGERPHKCNICGKTFIQSGQLVIHNRTHTGEKPYKCPAEGCGKGFTCSKQLKVHSRTHTGEKPYRCDICDRDFGYNHVLKLHRVQHYGSKCYKCTICDETFKNKKEMEAHIKGHANDMPDADDDEGAMMLETEKPLKKQVSSPPPTRQLPSPPRHEPKLLAKEEMIHHPVPSAVESEQFYHHRYMQQRLADVESSSQQQFSAMHPISMMLAAAKERENEFRPPSNAPSLSPPVSLSPNSNQMTACSDLTTTYEALSKLRNSNYYAPAAVPEYKPLLGSSDEVVKRLEAALATTEPETPPRSSSEESPERSSSPEMADRDNNTLPPRKRRLYFNTDNDSDGANLRMSSVIQFAKAT
ncbi:Krueppel homolog 1-like isoform X1 [Culicoides brevitarsis]|uniref:Krueppel homolog 1-like isoform X1 n=2 Tax=Culicoides brevitarsis TaxID=469753 RepID=UPI00307B83AA